jgi:hypothetical protein
VLRDVRFDHVDVYDLRHDPDELAPLEAPPPELRRTLQELEQRLFSRREDLVWPYVAAHSYWP